MRQQALGRTSAERPGRIGVACSVKRPVRARRPLGGVPQEPPSENDMPDSLLISSPTQSPEHTSRSVADLWRDYTK